MRRVRMQRPTGVAVLLPWLALVAGAALLSGCTNDGSPSMMSAAPRGASVAFESIDGPPQLQFYTLVRDLNEEAELRRLAVISREKPATYHVRGYLAAATGKSETTISWIWDVFDEDGQRALRISGTEAVPARRRDAWGAADDTMLRQIARKSMDQLGAFLTSPEAAPAEATGAMAMAEHDSPESAGIFRIIHAEADPVAGENGGTPAAVPLPPPRPTVTAASRSETVALAASER